MMCSLNLTTIFSLFFKVIYLTIFAMMQIMFLHILREVEKLYRMTVSALKSDVSKWFYVTGKVEPQSHKNQTFQIVSFSKYSI